MPRVEIREGDLMIELDSEHATVGHLLELATYAMDCRVSTGLWVPDVTEVAALAETPEMTTNEPTR